MKLALLALAALACLADASGVETAGRALRAVEPSWREPVARFLNGAIDAPALRRSLEARSGSTAAQPEQLSQAYVQALAGDFLRRAASDAPQDRYETARAYAELDLVLAGLLDAQRRAPVTLAASEARRLLAGQRQKTLDAALSRVAAELSGPARADDAVLASPLELALAELPAADLFEIELPYLRAALARVKLDGAGAIALDESGFPDEESYLAASKARWLLQTPLAKALASADRALLKGLSALYDRTLAARLTGDNELGLAHYAEPAPGGLDLSVLDHVRRERFKTPRSWVWSSQHSLSARQGYATITAETSASPFVKQLGPGAFTTVYWAALPEGEFGEPAPLGMRLRVNSDGLGRERTMEVLAPVGREEDGALRWKGFYFKKMAGEWVLGSPKRAGESHRCISCHHKTDSEGRRRLTPLPAQLRTKADFLKVGYQDTLLLERYLRSLR